MNASYAELVALLDDPQAREAAARELLARARAVAYREWGREGDGFVEEVVSAVLLRLCDRHRPVRPSHDGYLWKSISNAGKSMLRRRGAPASITADEPTDLGELAPLELAGTLAQEALDALLDTAETLELLHGERRTAVQELVEVELGETTMEALTDQLASEEPHTPRKVLRNRIQQRHSRARRLVLLPAHQRHVEEHREHPLEAALLRRLSVLGPGDV